MATCTSKTETRKTYTLTLDEREADAISTVIAFTVASCPGTPADDAIAVLRAIQSAGLDYYGGEAFGLVNRSSVGQIYFKSYPKAAA